MIEEFDKDPLNTNKADELLSRYIDVYNKIMEKVPEGLSVGIHLCRGNFVKSRHFNEGSYDRIAVRLLRNLKVPILYLEFDTEQAEGLEPLKHLPTDKNVLLGVVSSKYPKLEDLDATVARIYEATPYIAKGS